MLDLRAIYRAETIDGAVAPCWRRAWEHMVPLFAFPPALRKMNYTTNAVESLHRPG